jgi:prephenate dehydratase
MPTVAYQGHPGAFSDVAARRLVADAETVGYSSFDAAAAAFDNGETAFCVLPVENAIAGPIARTYDILWERPGLRILDETALPIEMCLVAAPGATIDDIREVRSHPVALEQVRRLLDAHPEWRRTSTTDTAGAVAEVMSGNDPSVAAIGPALAADIYGATVLLRGVEDESRNSTRFFLLGTSADESAAMRGSRACIGIVIAHRPGSLRDALGAFADRGLDLRSLLSRPLRDEPFRYRFFCELTGVDDKNLTQALAVIGGTSRILGRY